MMRRPYWRDSASHLYLGDAIEVLGEMPTGCVDCVVTSPPYWGPRDYGADGQYGQEPTLDGYVDTLRRVFAELHRVLACDGTVWLNLGDGYSGGRRTMYDTTGGNLGPRGLPSTRRVSGLAGENLLGIPWRVALALQEDGWILRNAICWHKPNAMPESVRDRLACRHETIFLLVKQDRYWFDLDPVRQPLAGPEALAANIRFGGRQSHAGCLGASARRRYGRAYRAAKYHAGPATFGGQRHGHNLLPTGRRHAAAHPRGRNPGDVWSIPTRPNRVAHLATFPIDIPLRAIAAGCRPGGTVADPFAGTATTGLAARQLHRSFIGIELSREYCDLAKQRLETAAS